MSISLEIYEQGVPEIIELKEFWIAHWNRVLLSQVEHGISDNSFYTQSYFYVIRDTKKNIIASMSSAEQHINDINPSDSYYSAWPEAINYIKKSGIKSFHKMGMIIANKSLIPSFLRVAPTIIGCGMKFVKRLPHCEAVVSFPRVDNIVYRSCTEWGFDTVKTDLSMYNSPVNFVLKSAQKGLRSHFNPDIQQTVDELWLHRTELLRSDRYKKVA